MKLSRRISLLVSLLALSAAASLWAGVDSRIVGKVVDADGEPLEGVVITISAQEVTYQATAETNKKGKFTLTILDASRTFEARLEKEGFQTIVEPIDPPVGDIMRAEWTMVPAGAAPAALEEMQRLDTRNKAAKIYNEGAELYNQGQLEQAIVKMDEALAEDPDLALALAAKARAHLDLADEAEEATRPPHFEAALAAGRRLLELAPDEPFARRFMFDGLWGLNRREEAEQVLAELAQQDPSGQTAARYFNIGVDAIRDNDLEKAVSAFTSAVEIHPALKEAYLNLALVASAQKRYEAALEQLDRYLELDPGNARALSMRYEAHTALGNTEQADVAFAELKAVDPASVADTFFKRGTEQWNQGQTAAAIENFQRVLEVSPEHPRAHYQLGLAYVSSGRIDEGRKLLERFLEIAPDDPEAETARAMLSSLG